MGVSYNGLVGRTTNVSVLVVPQRDAFKLHSDSGRRIEYIIFVMSFIAPNTYDRTNQLQIHFYRG